ncbi:MAG: 16S rRNA (cytosine(967)-C(5))-methyltransferase, partial [Lentisphaeraceae bacterium]|nr:16S rRNA (cytosine(967)-C(5))-methyltransferase [Lentisphaeraceae bacterium]
LPELPVGLVVANADLIPSCGRWGYSPCSVDPQENEQVVEAFLAENDEFELKESKTLYPCEKHDGAFAALLVKK